jgi:homogentisate 1,2-dioxygenase
MFPPELKYQSGFGNDFATEAMPGALPAGQNAPQKPPYGLYIEELNGTPFTAPRDSNRRTWTYRIRPTVLHTPFSEIPSRLIRTAPFDEVPAPPNQLRWRPLPNPAPGTDFIDGIVTLGGNGDASAQNGIAIHVYACNTSMKDRYFYNADGEMLIVAQVGGLLIRTELGILDIRPDEICVIPRGIKFQVEVLDELARGYICENYGMTFRLPELGPIGASGLANSRDFMTPVAAFEDRDADVRLAVKFLGKLWEAKMDHSPLDVVSWHGRYAPYKYNLTRFNCINSVTYDHPDPSIFCVLVAPSSDQGMPTVEFGCIPPRWLVAEHTFRPPPYHRNIASEFMGLIRGQYIGKAKAEGFIPGSASLHNCMAGHGPDAEAFERGRDMELKPTFLDNTLAMHFESRLVVRPTKFALEGDLLERDYYKQWQSLKKYFPGEAPKQADEEEAQLAPSSNPGSRA